VTWGAGATLVVPQRHELLTPVDYLTEQRITHWSSVPSVMTVADRLRKLPPGRATGLRHAVFLGEQLTYEQARLWRRTAPNAVIENAYGPTELTVTCTAYRLPQDPECWPGTANDTVPIGPVHDHLEHLVLDAEGRPAAEGELCVRGPQRFDGYLDPEDDRHRFLTHRPGSDPATVAYEGGAGVTPAHYYRTGDRVRSEDGRLVHLGRIDDQVKLHGYRIEPGEVESRLRRHPAVTDTVVLAVSEASRTVLVACYTGEPRPSADLARWLRRYVPTHMAPSRFVHRESLPHNANGKVDRSALRRELETSPLSTHVVAQDRR
jgi:acyl-coenzyme A synthetase/AMP-(fatty) acid ligase